MTNSYFEDEHHKKNKARTYKHYLISCSMFESFSVSVDVLLLLVVGAAKKVLSAAFFKHILSKLVWSWTYSLKLASSVLTNLISCWSNVSGGDDEDNEDGGEHVVDEDETDVLLGGCITLNNIGNFDDGNVCWMLLLLLKPTAEVKATRMGVVVGVRPAFEELLQLIAKLSFFVTSSTNVAIRFLLNLMPSWMCSVLVITRPSSIDLLRGSFRWYWKISKHTRVHFIDIEMSNV